MENASMTTESSTDGQRLNTGVNHSEPMRKNFCTLKMVKRQNSIPMRGLKALSLQKSIGL